MFATSEYNYSEIQIVYTFSLFSTGSFMIDTLAKRKNEYVLFKLDKCMFSEMKDLHTKENVQRIACNS